MLRLWTDGSIFMSRGAAGGWAFLYYMDGEKHWASGCEAPTTINIMEMTAAIRGLQSIVASGYSKDSVLVISDSQYLVYGASKWIKLWKQYNWVNSNGRPVANRALWEELDHFSKMLVVKWQWVRGHNGHSENEIVDKLSRQAAIRVAV